MYRAIEPDLEWLCESEYFMEKPTKIRIMSNEEAVRAAIREVGLLVMKCIRLLLAMIITGKYG